MNTVKIYIENGNELEIDKNVKIKLLNLDEFLSDFKMEKENNKQWGVPIEHYIFRLEFSLIIENNQYLGEAICDTYKGINSIVDNKCPYKVELINWRLADNIEKYIEFNIEKKSSY